MSALPQPAQEPAPLRPVAGRRAGGVASASAWTLSSMAVMSLVRLGSQMALTHLIAPRFFGVVVLMRTFLTFVEMASDMGLRSAIVAHPRAEERSFLGTAYSIQLLRGVGMWLITCALAWPLAGFYGEPAFLWLLPIAGFEAVNNGLFSVRSYVHERRMSLALPTLLDVLGLVVSVGTSIVWAWLSPGVAALAFGPLVGGAVRTATSHWVFRGERVGFAWDRGIARELFTFSRWIIGSTTVTFVAQQFHMLFLGKLVAKSVLGVYGIAWSLCATATKPMTVLANRVLIPHLAQANRDPEVGLDGALRASMNRFLPACLLVCVGAGLFATALFELLYSAEFVEGGRLARFFAVVVWFMILQQVPRSVLLSVGDARWLARMSGWNATLTVVGVTLGFLWDGGSLTGAILGNALGNVAGCLVGWLGLKRRGLHAGRAMVLYSLCFLGVLGAGVAGAEGLVSADVLTRATSSVVTTAACAAPLALWVWLGTIAPLRRRGG